MKKLINLVLIFVAVAVLVVAAVEFKRLHAAAKTNHDATVAVLKRNAAMKAQIDILNPASSQPMGASADASAKILAKDKADLKKREQSDAQQKEKMDALKKWMVESVRDNSELALRHYASLRSRVEIEIEPFRRVQHLSKEQSEALAEVMFQQKLRNDDAMRAVQLKQLSREDADAISQLAFDEFTSNAKAALGDDLYEKFSAYQLQRPAWDFVGTYGGEMSRVDTPLSVEQASQLVDAIVNACPVIHGTKGSVVIVDFGLTKVDWSAVDAAAVNFLTPEQMNYLKNVTVGYVLSRQYQELNNALQKLGQ